MKQIQVTLTFEVDDAATTDEIQTLVDHAAVQIEDPRDDDGEYVDFTVGRLDADWFEVARSSGTACPLCGEAAEREDGNGPWAHRGTGSLWCEDGRRGLEGMED